MGLFKLVWTDEDFETIPPDIVIPSAELDRWPGIEPDPETEARIARDVLEGYRRAVAAQRAADGSPAPAPAQRS